MPVRASRPLLDTIALAVAVASLAACSEDKPRPSYAFEGTTSGSPCERAGFRCVPGGLACGDGTVSAGKSLGCPGESAVCCMPAPEGGARDASADASVDADADAGLDANTDADAHD